MPQDWDIEREDEEDSGLTIVSFSDEVAHTRSDLVDQAAAAIASFLGVTEAWREDREVILVRGDVDPRELENQFATWWAAHRS